MRRRFGLLNFNYLVTVRSIWKSWNLRTHITSPPPSVEWSWATAPKHAQTSPRSVLLSLCSSRPGSKLDGLRGGKGLGQSIGNSGTARSVRCRSCQRMVAPRLWMRRAPGGGLQAAWDALIPAVDRFPKEPTIPYNLACYACQLEKLDEARRWFQRALGVGQKAKLKSMGASDPDLRPLWGEIKTL